MDMVYTSNIIHVSHFNRLLPKLRVFVRSLSICILQTRQSEMNPKSKNTSCIQLIYKHKFGGGVIIYIVDLD